VRHTGYYYLTPEFTPPDAEEYLMELHVKQLVITKDVTSCFT